jgi:ATP-binding cassette subfamily F protein 3
MDDYRKLLLEERRPPGSKVKPVAAKLSKAEERKAAADRRAQVTPLKRAVDEAEKRLAKLQGELAKIEAVLNEPDFYDTVPSKVTTVTKQRADMLKQIEAAETVWLEASETYENARAALEASD